LQNLDCHHYSTLATTLNQRAFGYAWIQSLYGSFSHNYTKLKHNDFLYLTIQIPQFQTSKRGWKCGWCWA